MATSNPYETPESNSTAPLATAQSSPLTRSLEYAIGLALIGALLLVFYVHVLEKALPW